MCERDQKYACMIVVIAYLLESLGKVVAMVQHLWYPSKIDRLR